MTDTNTQLEHDSEGETFSSFDGPVDEIDTGALGGLTPAAETNEATIVDERCRAVRTLPINDGQRVTVIRCEQKPDHKGKHKHKLGRRTIAWAPRSGDLKAAA